MLLLVSLPEDAGHKESATIPQEGDTPEAGGEQVLAW
jgi:hypothetical protein